MVGGSLWSLSTDEVTDEGTAQLLEGIDAQIVSRMKSSSLILILEIAKEELSCTGVVPATESPMSKSECVNQEKLC